MRKKPKTCDTKNTDKYCVKETREPPNEVRKSGSTPKRQKEFTDATPIPDHSGTLTAVEKSLSELKRILTLLTPTSSRSPTEDDIYDRCHVHDSHSGPLWAMGSPSTSTMGINVFAFVGG